MSQNSLSVNTAATQKSAVQLDDIAQRVERVMNLARETVAVQSAGADKVSVTAANTFNTVAKTFDEQMTAGTKVMREVSTAITTHGASVTQVDDEVATTIVFV